MTTLFSGSGVMSNGFMRTRGRLLATHTSGKHLCHDEPDDPDGSDGRNQCTNDWSFTIFNLHRFNYADNAEIEQTTDMGRLIHKYHHIERITVVATRGWNKSKANLHYDPNACLLI
jgi:hypothetical protein